jgi:hypothetical protein
VSVLELHAVGRAALGTQYFDYFRFLVVLADHPAVLDKTVALGCTHLQALLMITTAV